jgi:hypothetical protein
MPKRSSHCCNLQFACNFSNLVAVLSVSAAQLTVSGLNGASSPLGSCGCREKSPCEKFKACNKIQVNSITTPVAGVATTVLISSIVQNSGGLFIATLDPTLLVVGNQFTVSVTNPAVPCSGSVIGIMIA